MTEETKEAKIESVPTNYGYRILLEDGTEVSESELIIKIYNKLLKIERSVA